VVYPSHPPGTVYTCVFCHLSLSLGSAHFSLAPSRSSN
jgi:hypothetical protein